MSVWVLVLVYQSYMTRGIAMTNIGPFLTQEQCEIEAKKLDGYDKKDCVKVFR